MKRTPIKKRLTESYNFIHLIPNPKESKRDAYHLKNNKLHKPLILRGARQVGKTTLIKQFSENYE